MNGLDNILAETQAQSSGGTRLSKEEFAAMKAVYALADQVALDVTGSGAAFQKFLDLQTRLDRYSANNMLLIYAQKPSASKVGSVEYWNNQGCSVIKDEKEISIIEPRKNYARQDGGVGHGYEIRKVFDISQVDVSTRPPRSPESQPTERDLLKSLVAHAPVQINLVDELSGNRTAMYDHSSDSISVCRGRAFADTFKSLAMEIGYVKSDTDINPFFVSECAAYVLCKKYGVDTQGFYFSHVPEQFQSRNVQDIKAVLTQIRDVTADISECMAKTLAPPNRGARRQDDRVR